MGLRIVKPGCDHPFRAPSGCVNHPLKRLRLESTKITDTGAADLKKPLPESAII